MSEVHPITTPRALLAESAVPSDRFLAAIVESSDDAIITKTLEGVITSWNRAAEHLYGYTAAEAVGQPISLIIPADRPDELPTIMERLRRGERIDHFETVRVHKDGTRRDVSLSISPIRGDSEAIIGAASIGRDITAQKRMELEQRAMLEIINHVGRLLIAELDLEMLVQAVTDAATTLAGAQFGAFLYNAVDDRGEYYTLYAIAGVPREFFADFPLPRNTPLFGPTFRGEGTVRSADVRQDPRFGQNPPYFGMPAGHLPVVSYLAVPVVGRAGEVLGGLFFGHPEPNVFGERAERLVEGLAAQSAVAVENARLFQQVQQELDARRHLEGEREAFIDAVAHDLGNPLTAIKGQAQLLRRRAQKGRLDAPRVETSLTAIEEATDRASRLIAELADVVRLGAQRPLELKRLPVDLVALVQATIASYAEASRHQVMLETTVATLVGWWDPDRLMRVLENLLANAVKYSPAGSVVDVRIAREVVADGELAVVVVRDHGIGIPTADLPYIFERFRRGGNVAGRYRGTGLGLWGSQRIVTQHGGTISVESTEGQGTTVTVRLPLADQPSDDAMPGEPTPNPLVQPTSAER